MQSNLLMEITSFVNFSLQRLMPNPCLIDDGRLIECAFEETVLDFRYHFTEMLEEEIKKNILRNQGGLTVFLYRLVREMVKQGYKDDLKYQIHFLMKVLCGCEIYWSTEIDVGFYVDHGLGIVIGSRSKIGKGFRIYQGCTVGHMTYSFPNVKPKTFIPEECKREGPKIGNDVILYANSLILGDITIGDNTIIAANSLVLNDVEGHQMVAGNPAKPVKLSRLIDE